MSRTVSFTVTNEKRCEMDIYAAAKGFRTASDLARYATTQHMSRYPIAARKGKKGLRAVQPEAPAGRAEATQ